MGCGCGNSGCSGCNSIPLPIECGARPCSPLADCQSANPSSPTPYYGAAPQCQENHCQQITVQNYNAAIKNDRAFNLPNCGENVTIYSEGLKTLAIGSYLWNPTYGYLKVISFDFVSSQIIAQNTCQQGNAAVGTNVPACTAFVITDTPQSINNPSFFPFVALDFTAPANGNCLDITVTNVNGLVVGNSITIGSGTYTLNAISSSTVINICNNGSGITPGTPVFAKDASGNYQYQIGLIAVNPCGNPVVSTGVILACSGGGPKPLDGANIGNLIQLIDPALNTAAYVNPCNNAPIAAGGVMGCNGSGGIAPLQGGSAGNVLQITGGNTAQFLDISCGDFKNAKNARATNATGSSTIVTAAGVLSTLTVNLTPVALINPSICRTMQIFSVATYTIDYTVRSGEGTNDYYAFNINFYIDRGDGAGLTLIKTYNVSGHQRLETGDLAASRFLKDFVSFAYQDLIPVTAGASFAFPVLRAEVVGLAPFPAVGVEVNATANLRLTTVGIAV